MIDPNEFEQLQRAVTRIELAVCGDLAMGNPGIASKLGDHETRLRGLEEIKTGGMNVWKAAGIVGGLFLALITVAGVVVEIVRKLKE